MQTLPRPSSAVILDVTKTESDNCLLYIEQKQNGNDVFASSLTASNIKRANLSGLPLIMHWGHTGHNYL